MLDDVWRKAVQDIKEKSYASRFAGDLLAECRRLDTSLMNIKETIKPINWTKGGVKPFAAGQGTASSTIQLLAMTLIFGRFAYYLDQLSERKDDMHQLIQKFGKSQRMYIQDINEMIGIVKDYNLVEIIGDVGKSDKGMTEFSSHMHVEYFVQVLGMDREIASFIKMADTNAAVVTPFLIGKTQHQLLSGRTGTKHLNEINNKLTLCWVTEGVGSNIVTYEGDDCAKWQAGLKFLPEKWDEIAEYVNYSFEVLSKQKVTDFCGYLYSQDSGMVPNLVRMIQKAMCYPHQNFEQFHEYQQSMLDNMRLIEMMDYNDIISANAEIWGVRWEEIQDIIECYYGIACITEKEWESQVQTYEYRHNVARRGLMEQCLPPALQEPAMSDLQIFQT